MITDVLDLINFVAEQKTRQSTIIIVFVAYLIFNLIRDYCRTRSLKKILDEKEDEVKMLMSFCFDQKRVPEKYLNKKRINK